MNIKKDYWALMSVLKNSIKDCSRALRMKGSDDQTISAMTG